jgi:hypothetical protein
MEATVSNVHKHTTFVIEQIFYILSTLLAVTDIIQGDSGGVTATDGAHF